MNHQLDEIDDQGDEWPTGESQSQEYDESPLLLSQGRIWNYTLSNEEAKLLLHIVKVARAIAHTHEEIDAIEVQHHRLTELVNVIEMMEKDDAQGNEGSRDV